MFHNQLARRNQGDKFSIAKFGQQPKDVPVNRLLPYSLAWLKVAADNGSVDSRIERSAVEREQTALGITYDADAGCVLTRGGSRGFCFEPIHRRKNLLGFVTDNVPSQLIGLTVNPFAMGLVRETPEARIS